MNFYGVTVLKVKMIGIERYLNTHIMKPLILAICMICCVSIHAQTSKQSKQNGNRATRKTKGHPTKPQWIQLFNGKDILDWIPKISGHELNENYGNTFRVENGLLKVSYDQYDDFNRQYGHLFYKQPFSSYIVAVEYRFTGQQAKGGEGWAYRNSGIMLHCQAPETMTKEQDFPISIEVQLLGGDSTGERTTANLCTPGTQVMMDNKEMKAHCYNSTSKTFRGDQWVRVEVIVLKDSVIRHIVNGDTVLVYQKPQVGGGNVSKHDPAVKKDGMLLSSGYISVQSESHPVEFRKIEIMELDGPKQPAAVKKRKLRRQL
jgi:3-keto-disaccharide hydrolase